MVNRIAVVTSIFIISSVLFGQNQQHKFINGVIEKDVDGDTVWLQSSGAPGRARLKIRMIGMDAPETHLPTPKHGVVSQGHWGDDATDELTEMIPVGTDVRVRDEGKDKYGRVLGRIYVNNEDVNLKMVQSGWAIPYIICSGKTCNPSFFADQNVNEYVTSCERAKKAGNGIFDPSDPLKEMPFEFRLRMQDRKADKFVGNFVTNKLYEPENYNRVPVCRRIFFMKESEALKVGYQPTY